MRGAHCVFCPFERAAISVIPGHAEGVSPESSTAKQNIAGSSPVSPDRIPGSPLRGAPE
jgi:hypothetical protein